MLLIEVVILRHLFPRNYVRKVVKVPTSGPASVVAFLAVMIFGRRNLGDGAISTVFIDSFVMYSASLNTCDLGVIRIRHSDSHVSILTTHAHQSYHTLSVSRVVLMSPVLAVIQELSLFDGIIAGVEMRLISAAVVPWLITPR